MSRPTQIVINQAALQHNYKQIQKAAPNSRVLAMVKANAYGHGVETIAKTLPEADAFGVACLEEAVRLRSAGITQPIVLMEGFFQATELAHIVELNLETVIHNFEQVEMLEQFKPSKSIKVWLKINTGMNRLGINPKHTDIVWQRLTACTHVNGLPRLISHFAESDQLNNPLTTQQLEIFEKATNHLPGERSMANSAAILTYPKSHKDWVRPGIMLYGISPFADKTGQDFNLKPVMTVRSELIAIQQCQKDDAVGYGGQWLCPEPMLVGIVAIGYGDGYPWRTESGTPVLLNNSPTCVIGRISMDMLAVDLRQQPTAKIGDSVVLWGEGLPVETIAKYTGTFSYELLTRLTQRLYVSNIK